MKTSLFNYILPEELIAQHPIKNRDHSRLLILDKKTNEITHKHFYNLVDELTNNDVLVINNTKVIPARLIGKKETGGVIEILLLHENEDDTWECLIKPAKRLKENQTVYFSDLLNATLIKRLDEGRGIFKMNYKGIFLEALEKLGEMPLPPYIHEKLKNKNSYQTIYAKENGSAAAPTAGLHFTKDLLEKIKNKGIEIIEITLHVGLGTFRPVKEANIINHKMHQENYYISKEAEEKLNKAIKNKKNIIPVGTTSLRTLEANYNNGFHSGYYNTDIFIYPGYKFKVVKSLITNFHLPESTLIMLVSALSSKESILMAYNEAIKKKYKFFSFGDAMFIK